MNGKQRGTAAALAALLALSLTACAATGSTAGASPAAETAAGEEPSASPAAAPSASAAAEEPSWAVYMTSESEDYKGPDGQTVVLTFRCVTPEVKAVGRSDAADAVNETLAGLRDAFASGTGDTAEGALSGVEAYRKAALEEYDLRQSSGDTSVWCYALERSVLVARGDSAVLSFVYDEYTDAGGAHGYTGRSGVSFDMRTGAQLSLDDLTNDPAAFRSLCVQRVLELSQGPEYDPHGFFTGYEDTLNDLVADGHWYLSDAGLVFVANPYDIGPYAAGRFEFTIPYAELTGLLRQEYLPAGTSPDGTLSAVLGEGSMCAAPTYTVDDGTDAQGQPVMIWATGSVTGVRLTHVQYRDYNGAFEDAGTLWYCPRLADNEAVRLLTWIPDTMPNLRLSYTDAEGAKSVLLSQSGKDGSLLLLKDADFATLPRNISDDLPFAYDLDGDGAKETVDVQEYADSLGNTNLALAVTTADGKTLTEKTTIFSKPTVWAADIDGDGKAELYLSGDMGSDDYITYCWRYDGALEPVQFSGDTRQENAGATEFADGEVVGIAGGQLTMESFVYMLGTYGASRPYALAADGTLAPAEGSSWSFARNDYWLELARDLPAVLTDGTQTTLTAGSKLLLTGTDGTSWMSFQTEDGMTGTLAVAKNTAVFGWTVSGVDENDCFVTLPYAG